MIDLSGATPFASGSNRHCYRHPEQPDRCLKIVRPENIEARYQRQPPLKKVLGKKRLDDNRQELDAHAQSALRRLLHQGQDELAWSHLPRFYGETRTTLGLANESELLLDTQGKPAETLERYLARKNFDSFARELVHEFTDWLRLTGVLTRNLLPHNLVIAARDGGSKLFLVDGLGAPPVPTLLAVNDRWRLHYIDRRIRRFYRRIEWETGSRDQPWELSQKL